MSQLVKEHHRLHLLLSEAEQITLEEAVRHHPRPDARERATALLRDRSRVLAAKEGLLRPRDPDSLYQWLEYYQKQGIAGLFGHRHGGPYRRRREMKLNKPFGRRFAMFHRHKKDRCPLLAGPSR